MFLQQKYPYLKHYKHFPSHPLADVGGSRSADDVERTKQNKSKRGFVKKIVGGFRYKPRRDWFSFAPVNKL